MLRQKQGTNGEGSDNTYLGEVLSKTITEKNKAGGRRRPERRQSHTKKAGQRKTITQYGGRYGSRWGKVGEALLKKVEGTHERGEEGV